MTIGYIEKKQTAENVLKSFTDTLTKKNSASYVAGYYESMLARFIAMSPDVDFINAIMQLTESEFQNR